MLEQPYVNICYISVAKQYNIEFENKLFHQNYFTATVISPVKMFISFVDTLKLIVKFSKKIVFLNMTCRVEHGICT